MLDARLFSHLAEQRETPEKRCPLVKNHLRLSCRLYAGGMGHEPRLQQHLPLPCLPLQHA